jgi:hypothetical protein
MFPDWDAPLWYQEVYAETLSGRRALRHLHALSNTPYSPPVNRREIRRHKTRDYRRRSWPRQPIELLRGRK